MAPVPQAHIYSLAATLKAALEYAVEPEPEPRLSTELETLLSQMQAEEPADRPRLEVSAPEPRPHASLGAVGMQCGQAARGGRRAEPSAAS